MDRKMQANASAAIHSQRMASGRGEFPTKTCLICSLSSGEIRLVEPPTTLVKFTLIERCWSAGYHTSSTDGRRMRGTVQAGLGPSSIYPSVVRLPQAPDVLIGRLEITRSIQFRILANAADWEVCRIGE